MVSMAILIRTFSSGIHTHPVSWNCAYHLRMELSDGGCFPNLVRNCRWTIVPRQSFWITLYLRLMFTTFAMHIDFLVCGVHQGSPFSKIKLPKHLKFQFHNNARVSSDADMAGYSFADKCNLDIVWSLKWRLGTDCVQFVISAHVRKNDSYAFLTILS